LYVSARGNDNVLRYNGTTGSFIDIFVATRSGGLAGPEDLVFGPDGNLYVSSPGGPQSVLRYDGVTGVFIDAFARNVQAAGLVFGPASIPEPSIWFLVTSGFLLLLPVLRRDR
jgi:hypothetical protein